MPEDNGMVVVQKSNIKNLIMQNYTNKNYYEKYWQDSAKAPPSHDPLNKKKSSYFYK